jgi:YggT family protein
MVVALIIQTLWSYLLSPVFWFLFILLGFRLFFCYRRSARTISYITMLDSLIGGILNWVQRLFYPKRTINDRQLVTTALVFFIVLYIAASFAIRFLVNFFGNLSF